MSENDDALIKHVRRITGFDASLYDALTEQGRENLEAYVDGCAPNTLAAFRGDLTRWVAWARANNIDPLHPTAREVKSWLVLFAVGRKMGTVTRMTRNLSVAFERIVGGVNPVRSELVAAYVRMLKRQTRMSKRTVTRWTGSIARTISGRTI